jgi:hypothetical protein
MELSMREGGLILLDALVPSNVILGNNTFGTIGLTLLTDDGAWISNAFDFAPATFETGSLSGCVRSFR